MIYMVGMRFIGRVLSALNNKTAPLYEYRVQAVSPSGGFVELIDVHDIMPHGDWYRIEHVVVEEILSGLERSAREKS